MSRASEPPFRRAGADAALLLPRKRHWRRSRRFYRRAILLHPAKKLARIIQRETHTAVRCGASQAALICAVDGKASGEKDRIGHGRTIIFIRKMIGVHALDDEVTRRRFIAAAPAGNLPHDRFFRGFSPRSCADGRDRRGFPPSPAPGRRRRRSRTRAWKRRRRAASAR